MQVAVTGCREAGRSVRAGAGRDCPQLPLAPLLDVRRDCPQLPSVPLLDLRRDCPQLHCWTSGGTVPSVPRPPLLDLRRDRSQCPPAPLLDLRRDCPQHPQTHCWTTVLPWELLLGPPFPSRSTYPSQQYPNHSGSSPFPHREIVLFHPISCRPPPHRAHISKWEVGLASPWPPRSCLGGPECCPPLHTHRP